MRLIRSRKGNAYVYLCILVMFMATLVSLVILYMGLCARIQLQKRDVQSKLDGYVAQYAVDNFEALKQGDVYLDMIDWRDFEKRAIVHLGFPDEETQKYEYPNGQCYMTRPQAAVLRGDGFGITVRYTAAFYVAWNGKIYTDIRIPMQITSYYKIK